MPWLRTGERRRSSYEMFGIVDRLGFSPTGPVGMAIRLWPLMPLLLAALAAVAAWWGWRRVAAPSSAVSAASTPRCWAAPWRLRFRSRARSACRRRRRSTARRPGRWSSDRCCARTFGYRPAMPTRAEALALLTGPAPFEIGPATIGGEALRVYVDRAEGPPRRLADRGRVRRRGVSRVRRTSAPASPMPMPACASWWRTSTRTASARATGSRSRCATIRSG